jgi:hypothetical protein
MIRLVCMREAILMDDSARLSQTTYIEKEK